MFLSAVLSTLSLSIIKYKINKTAINTTPITKQQTLLRPADLTIPQEKIDFQNLARVHQKYILTSFFVHISIPYR